MVTLLRTGLIIAAVFSVPSLTTNKFLLSEPWMFFNLAVNGLLMGVLSAYTMILGTQKVEKKGFRVKMAGYIMASHLVFGLSVGSISGFCMGKIVR